MNAEIQAYSYVVLTVFITVTLYLYIYHLYTKRKDSDGHDYEEYSNLALHDSIEDTPVKPILKDDEK